MPEAGTQTITAATKIRTNPDNRFRPATSNRGSRGIRDQPRNSPTHTEKRIRISPAFPWPSFLLTFDLFARRADCQDRCEPTAHRFVQKFFLPRPHRLLASRPEPTFHPPEMSVQPASLGSGPSLPFVVLRRAWVVCLEEEPGYSGSPGGGDDRS